MTIDGPVVITWNSH